MKLSESQWKAIGICIQSVITALLLLVQSLLSGCVTADNGSVIDHRTEVNIPINVPAEIGG